jgi:DNA-binding transcriptional LysR family regulator
VGFLPRYMAQPHIDAGALLVRAVQRSGRIARCSYAWRHEASASTGRALRWWLEQLERPATRRALLSRP